jgi:hypothetical protein
VSRNRETFALRSGGRTRSAGRIDLVADGHTTSENGLLTREQIISHHNQTLANPAIQGVTVRVLSSDEVGFG